MSEETQSDLHELEHVLKAAEERRTEASKALRAKWKGGELEAYRRADEEVLVAERVLAQAKHQQFAQPLDFPVKWESGAPLPHLLKNEHRTFLMFYVRVIDPKWDGTSPAITNPASDQNKSLALVEFKRCISAKLGSPNDEVLHGHPLHGKGLEPYTAQIVKNSYWIAEIEKINSVHRGYRSEFWLTLNHYVLWFHDSTFECIAQSFTVEERTCSMAELLSDVCQRLLGKA